MESTASSNKVSRRRAQNAAAQRSYRAKQKQKMQRLEALTIAALTSAVSPDLSCSLAGDRLATRQGQLGHYQEHEHSMQYQPTLPAAFLHQQPTESAGLGLGQTTTLHHHQGYSYPPTASTSIGSTSSSGSSPQSDEWGLIRTTSNSPAAHHNGSSVVTFSQVYRFMRSCTPRERQTFNVVMAREHFGFRDLIKYGLIRLGYAMDISLFERAKDASPRAWVRQVLGTVGSEVDILAVIAEGVRLLATLSLPSALLREGNQEAMQSAVFVAPPSATLARCLSFTPLSLASSLFANAELLGIDMATMSEDEDVALPPESLMCTKPDLRPTPAQLAVLHHPTVDVLPWPVFRANICAALAHDPPLVDDGELCLDLMNEGIRCWGSSTGDSMNGRGHGAPWDARSWEATPWFLEKWEPFTGGREGDMWRTSEWWRRMRE